MAEAEEGNTGNGKRRRKRKRRKAPGDPRQRRLEARRAQINLFRMIVHPVRRRVLHTLVESREPQTPAGLADTLDIPTATAVYHATILHTFDTVELATGQIAHDDKA